MLQDPLALIFLAGTLAGIALTLLVVTLPDFIASIRHIAGSRKGGHDKPRDLFGP